MKHGIMLPVAAAFMLIGVGAASADCAAELAKLSGGIIQDGSLAPLADTPPPATEGTAPTAAETPEGLQQDGTEKPLGASPDIATSAQDAASQSAGGDTAAAQATGEGHAAPDKQAALAKAQAALDAGDEAGCMAALEAAM